MVLPAQCFSRSFASLKYIRNVEKWEKYGKRKRRRNAGFIRLCEESRLSSSNKTVYFLRKSASDWDRADANTSDNVRDHAFSDSFEYVIQ